jgi:hypothetical protein
LHIFALAAENNTIDQWCGSVRETLYSYAKEMGCHQIDLQGRPGWEKVIGIEKTGIVMTDEVLG